LLYTRERSNGEGSGTRKEGILVVNPKPNKGFTSAVIDYLEKIIVKFMYDSKTPRHYLSGNFAPVPDETPPRKDLPVKGFLHYVCIEAVLDSVAECLNGEFVRVGPNPKFAPVGQLSLVHLFV
ncbi:hypothetical protein RJ641_036706, partial [Dillenia turbinata]